MNKTEKLLSLQTHFIRSSHGSYGPGPLFFFLTYTCLMMGLSSLCEPNESSLCEPNELGSVTSSQSKCSPINLHSNKLADSSIYINVFITSFAELPGLILAACIVDKIGRRISMVLMYSFCFIFLLPLMFHQNELLTTCLLFGARMCVIGAFTVAGIYCPEIYPTSVRSTGYGVANSVGRIAGMICPLVAVGLVSGCHQMTAIILFELAIILAGIGVLLLPIETKGRELNDKFAVNN